MDQQTDRSLAIAVEINLILQACNEDRKQGRFVNYMDLIVKEFLKIQEFILVNPGKHPPLKTVSEWLKKLLNSEKELLLTDAGKKLESFAVKYDKKTADE